MKNIDLCCGDETENRLHGYLLHDIDTKIKGLDYYCDLRDIDKELPNGFFNKARLSHALEHFKKTETISLLKKINRILTMGGELTVIVPNFKWHAKLVLNNEEDIAIYYAFGGQKDEYDIHYTAFTPEILKKVILSAGFAIDSISDRTSITCVAVKIVNE